MLRFGELNSGDVATSLENAEVQAWLAFDVAPTEVGATLQAAIKAKTVERVVVAATGPVPDDQLKVVEGEDIVYAIEKTKTGPGDKPVDPVVVSTIEITED